MAAFWVLDRSTFLTTRFYYLGLEKEVNNIVDICKAICLRYTVGGRQAEHKLQGVDGRGRYGNKGRQ